MPAASSVGGHQKKHAVARGGTQFSNGVCSSIGARRCQGGSGSGSWQRQRQRQLLIKAPSGTSSGSCQGSGVQQAGRQSGRCQRCGGSRRKVAREAVRGGIKGRSICWDHTRVSVWVCRGERAAAARQLAAGWLARQLAARQLAAGWQHAEGGSVSRRQRVFFSLSRGVGSNSHRQRRPAWGGRQRRAGNAGRHFMHTPLSTRDVYRVGRRPAINARRTHAGGPHCFQGSRERRQGCEQRSSTHARAPARARAPRRLQGVHSWAAERLVCAGSCKHGVGGGGSGSCKPGCRGHFKAAGGGAGGAVARSRGCNVRG